MADTQESVAQDILSKVMGKHAPKKGSHGLLGAGLHALKIPGMKQGGKVSKTGIYKLHAGETVVPAKKSHPRLDR